MRGAEVFLPRTLDRRTTGHGGLRIRVGTPPIDPQRGNIEQPGHTAEHSSHNGTRVPRSHNGTRGADGKQSNQHPHRFCMFIP